MSAKFQKDGDAPGLDSLPLTKIDSVLFQDILVTLEARLGRSSMTVGELGKMKIGSVVPLDVQLNELATLYLNDVPIARGEIVAVDDNFAIRVTEIQPVEGQ